MGVNDAALVVQDEDILHVPSSDENRDSVGSTFLKRRAFNSDFNLSSEVGYFCELVKQEVVVPLGEYQLFLHGDEFTSFPALEGCEAALAVQDVVAFQHILVREELSCLSMLREVSSIVVNEPTVSDLHLGAGSHDTALMVQDEVVHLKPDRDEVTRYVGSTIFNDTSF